MPLRCVIVDDNARFLEQASNLLAREGIDVVAVASNSADAVRLVEEHRPDVTLVDIELGEENGLDLARQLSEDGSKVVLVSTYAERDFAPLIESSPALGFVSKAHLSAEAILDTLEGSKSA